MSTFFLGKTRASAVSSFQPPPHRVSERTAPSMDPTLGALGTGEAFYSQRSLTKVWKHTCMRWERVQGGSTEALWNYTPSLSRGVAFGGREALFSPW